MYERKRRAQNVEYFKAGMCQDALEPFADLFAGFANLQPVTPNLGQELEIMHSQPAEMS